MKRLTMDFETRSACDLRKAGAYKYSLDSSTRPTCLAYKVHGSDAVHFLDFTEINKPWDKLKAHHRILWKRLIHEGYEFSCHNAFFETCIYKNILVKRYGWPDIPFESFRCTAAKAAACALPRNLEGAGEATKLSVQKDKRGYAAMMLTCKPTRQWNDWNKIDKNKTRYTPRQQKILDKGEPPLFMEPNADDRAREVWSVLYEYCKIDVLSEEKLDEALPDLIPQEQEIWFLNQRLNWRGLRVDIPTVNKIVGIMEIESKTKLKELDSLTMGLVTKPGARKSILDFLALEGIELPDIRAKTVDDALAGDELSETMRRLLEIRKALSKTSTRKYQAFLARAMPDGKCRDILLYHGASTGRDTGTGIQPHNFPRGAIKFDKERPYEPVENVVECNADTLRLLYGESLAILFSSILRNMIVPSKGKELFVADFSKIEVAVLWWLSDNEPGLKILRSGKDPYKYQAAENTGKKYKDIPDDSDDRQLGKAQVLGCGFGMGWEKFQATAFDQYRLKLTGKQSRAAVKSYRDANAAVPAVWEAYEGAAIEAVELWKKYGRKSGARCGAGKCIFQMRDNFLWVRLPSGRSLAYRDPQITMRVREYNVTEVLYNGEWKNAARLEDKDVNISKLQKREVKKYSEPKKTLEFWAVNSKTKKWSPERSWGGTLCENLVQATARDLMMQASVRLEKAGYKFLLSVHDEGLTEKTIGEGSLDEFTKIMTKKPKWAGDMPVEAKGWRGPRYRK